MAIRILFAAVFLLLPVAGNAQGLNPMTKCNDHADMAAELHERFGEVRTGVGLMEQPDGSVMLVEDYLNQANGSWTKLIVRTRGSETWACILASGTDWETVDSVPGSDA